MPREIYSYRQPFLHKKIQAFVPLGIFLFLPSGTSRSFCSISLMRAFLKMVKKSLKKVLTKSKASTGIRLVHGQSCRDAERTIAQQVCAAGQGMPFLRILSQISCCPLFFITGSLSRPMPPSSPKEPFRLEFRSRICQPEAGFFTYP